MGYYIHTCPKMSYKGEYYPSELCCPITNIWIDLQECVEKVLSKKKYGRFVEDPNIPPTKVKPNTLSSEIKFYFRNYKSPLSLEKLKVSDSGNTLLRSWQKYVGKSLAEKLVIDYSYL